MCFILSECSKSPLVVSPTNNWYQSPIHYKIEALLGYIQFFIEIMEYGYDEPESKEAEDSLQKAQKQLLRANRKKDNKAKTIVYQGLDKATFEIIVSVETSKEIWEALQQK